MWLSVRATLKETEVSSIKTKRTLTLPELGHDADRDRPSHLFPAGYDDSVAQRARCGTLVQPPFRPRHGTPGEEMCVVCLAISDWLHGANDRDREEWFERHSTNQPTCSSTKEPPTAATQARETTLPTEFIHTVAGPEDPIFSGARLAIRRAVPTPTLDNPAVPDRLPSVNDLAEKPESREQRPGQ